MTSWACEPSFWSRKWAIKYLTQHCQDNPWNEVWISLSLDQTKLDYLGKLTRPSQKERSSWKESSSRIWFYWQIQQVVPY
jgi:hypothetical protein